jgi:hypothetical protein
VAQERAVAAVNLLNIPFNTTGVDHDFLANRNNSLILQCLHVAPSAIVKRVGPCRFRAAGCKRWFRLGLQVGDGPINEALRLNVGVEGLLGSLDGDLVRVILCSSHVSVMRTPTVANLGRGTYVDILPRFEFLIRQFAHERITLVGNESANEQQADHSTLLARSFAFGFAQALGRSCSGATSIRMHQQNDIVVVFKHWQ